METCRDRADYSCWRRRLSFVDMLPFGGTWLLWTRSVHRPA